MSKIHPSGICALGALIVTCTLHCASFGDDLTVRIEPGEGWWGGATTLGTKAPFGLNASSLSFDIRKDNYSNQAAPQVAKGAKTREVVLPAGRWRDDEGKTFEGPCRLTVNTPISRLPYFEKLP